MCSRAPFLPPVFPSFFTPSFPFRPCSLSHHFSPLRLPLYPSFLDSRKSPTQVPLSLRYSLVSCRFLLTVHNFSSSSYSRCFVAYNFSLSGPVRDTPHPLSENPLCATHDQIWKNSGVIVRYFRNPCARDPPTRNSKNFKFFKNSLKILNVYFWGILNVYFWETGVYFWGTGVYFWGTSVYFWG